MWQPRLFTAFSRTPSQASRTLPLVAALALSQSSRAPPRRLLAHDRSCFHPFAGFSHMIACGSFRLSAVSSRTPSQASHTRSLVTVFVLLQSSCTRSLLAAFAFCSLPAQGSFRQCPLLPGPLLRSPPAHSRSWQYSLFTTVPHTVAQPETALSPQSSYTRSLSAVFALRNSFAHSRFWQHLLFAVFPRPGASAHSLFSRLVTVVLHSCLWQLAFSHTAAFGSIRFCHRIAHSCPWQLSLSVLLVHTVALDGIRLLQFSRTRVLRQHSLFSRPFTVFLHTVACDSFRFCSLLAHSRF